MRLENSELKTFQAVVEANGFNRAAESLHISQSAVSQAIATLENKLDLKLITRGKQLQLTAAGRRLLEYANEIMREEQHVLEDILRIKNGDHQRLNLAVNSSINRFYAPQLISQFCALQPNAELNIKELPSRDLIYAVLAERVDLAIGPFQRQMEAFEINPLFSETRHLVVSPNHPNVTTILQGNSKNLSQTPLITSSVDNPEMRPAIQRIRDRFKCVWEISSLNMRIHLVNQGAGVAFIDSKLLSEHPICREFQIMEGLTYGSIKRDVGIYWKKGKSLSGSSEQFVELCKAFWGEETSSHVR